jgi:hypothetical protein
MVSAVVGADGRLSDFRLLKAPFSGLGLEAAVLRALSQWEFEPARKDGQPVAVYMTLVVDFSLGNAPLSKDAGVPRAPAIAEALAAMVPGLAPAPAPVPESEVREIHAALSRLAEARRQHDLATCVGLLHPDYVAAFRANLLIWAQREDSAEGLRAAFGTSSVQVLESKSAEELWRTFALAAPPPTVVAEGEELRRVTTKGGPVLIFKRDGTSWKLLPNDRGLPWDWLLRDRLKPPDR